MSMMCQAWALATTVIKQLQSCGARLLTKAFVSVLVLVVMLSGVHHSLFFNFGVPF